MRWIIKSSLILFTIVLLTGCSVTSNAPESCREAGLETWTNEFIRCMNAGCLPDDADKVAEVLSVKVLAKCMKENQMANE